MTAARLTPSVRYRRLLHGVKFKEGEFLLRCGSCWAAKEACYWPLTLEFWNPRQGLTRCRACWAADSRRRQERRDREVRAGQHRRYYDDAHDVILFKKRQHYYANREAILARKRELYAARRRAA